jgi:3-deoxy-D-manno-octulosonic-acid transferase
MILLELQARHIPLVLVNARMSDRSFDRWGRMPRIAEALFEKIGHVVAQSDIDAERFRELGARPVTISGNLKVDAADLACDAVELDRLRVAVGRRPVWIAASTHPGEEETAISVHRTLMGQFPDLMTIIAPRHPERALEVCGLLEKAGLTYARRSVSDAITPRTAVYLGDTIGEMGLFFRLSEVAFVGRSLAASGGQNPLEPAALGVPVISGRNVENFRDAYRSLLAAGAARLIRNEEMLAANVAYLLEHNLERRAMAEAGRNTVAGMRGALEKTLGVLESHLFPLTVLKDLEGN